jgi:hypothetical protein
MARGGFDIEKARTADLTPRSRGSLRERLGAFARALRRLGRARPDGSASHVERMMLHIERGEWQAAEREALALGVVGEAANDRGTMKKAGRALRRLGVGKRAWELLAKANVGFDGPEWDGTPLVGRTLLIERREGDLGVFLQYAPLLAKAAALGGRAIVLVEPRMAPLYRRSFPRLDVRDEAAGAALRAEADVFASFETLAFHFWPDAAAQQAAFTPLLADRDLVEAFRTRHRDPAGRPLVGIAWGSLNKAKGLPALSDWGAFLSRLPARFVSLQYGDVANALGELDRMVRGGVVHDPSVDQLVDMDRFAAQVAAMDAVVTISNTGAHLAGALGTKTAVVLDDTFHLSWPVNGGPTLYPSASLVLRRGRPWRVVLDEVESGFFAPLFLGRTRR